MGVDWVIYVTQLINLRYSLSSPLIIRHTTNHIKYSGVSNFFYLPFTSKAQN